jgi:hypothetical protein
MVAKVLRVSTTAQKGERLAPSFDAACKKLIRAIRTPTLPKDREEWGTRKR